QSGLGGCGVYLLAALLWLSLLPLYALDSMPSQSTRSSELTMSLKSTRIPELSEGKWIGARADLKGKGRFPASLLFCGRHICGAVLIDKNWLASAAHCFQRSHKPSNYRILLGYNQLGSPSNYSRQMTVSTLIFHENYNKFYSQGSDIVLLQLHVPVTYNSHILPACFPDNTTNVSLEMACWISGWGLLNEDKFLPAPFHLQDAEVFLMDNKKCEQFFQVPDNTRVQYHAIKDDMMCAGDLINGKSICREDSGGPLTCFLNGTWYMIGLAIWSASCLEPISSPNIFTRVSYFSDWIQNIKKITPPNADPFSTPPEEDAPSLTGWQSRGTVIKPTICIALLSFQVLLWQLIWIRNL
uniref:Serine protease 39 n=1 Tax=Nannospalax galili TaxID=1026970 RepID=A0A8C6RNJ6_NANGA